MHIYRHLLGISCGWLIFAVIVGAFNMVGIGMSRLSRDPLEVANVPIYYGLLSNLGMLVWAAGAFISFFSSFQVRGVKVRSLLRWAGILTLILLLDDFFLLHDEVFPKLLGLPEEWVYGVYLLTFPVFFLYHLDIIRSQTEFRILALAIFLMSVSVLIDMDLLPGGTDVEDGFKIFGTIAYTYYWILTSHTLIATHH
jgi:hypothetical protein